MLHRSHNGEKAKQAVYEAKEAGFTDINIDLIYGLPRQTLEDIQHNLHILKIYQLIIFLRMAYK